jgi:hypothetical protein
LEEVLGMLVFANIQVVFFGLMGEEFLLELLSLEFVDFFDALD